MWVLSRDNNVGIAYLVVLDWKLVLFLSLWVTAPQGIHLQHMKKNFLNEEGYQYLGRSGTLWTSLFLNMETPEVLQRIASWSVASKGALWHFLTHLLGQGVNFFWLVQCEI